MTEGRNPKDLAGRCKPDLSLIPPSAMAHVALALADGVDKYTLANWRDPAQPVQARTYVSACMRHLAQWLDGEEFAQDSGAHHLGHAMACCAILLDAQAQGTMVDNRPRAGTASRTFEHVKALRLQRLSKEEK
jgi:hypothetical protein